MIRGGEAGGITGVADQEGGHDRTDSVEVGDGGAGSGHRLADQGLVGFDLPVQSPDVPQMGSRHESALFPDRVEGAYPLQHPGGLDGGQPFGYPTRSELHQHRMEATDRLGSQTGELVVAFGKHAQHLGIVLPPYYRQVGLTQRGDRYRPGIVRVVLIRLPRREHPDSRCQHRRHVHHLLASGDQLLGQQIAEPAGSFHRPEAAITVEVGSPPHQPVGLIPVGWPAASR